MIGGATALSPCILSELDTHLNLSAWPIMLAAGFALASLPRLPETNEDTRAALWVRGLMPFVLVVLIYAICEGSFGSWSNFYLSVDKHLGNRAGMLALSAFWASMTLLRTAARCIAGSLDLTPQLAIGSSAGNRALLRRPSVALRHGCVDRRVCAGRSGMQHLLPVHDERRARPFPEQQTQVAGLLVAALMVGEGVGSYGVGLLQRLQSLDHIFSPRRCGEFLCC